MLARPRTAAESSLAQAEPVLRALFPTYFHIGGIGDGSRAKLAINLILGLNRLALAEGLVLAERLGLDPAAFLDVARHTDDATDRFSALSALRDLGPPHQTAIPALIEALSDSNPEIRASCAMALGHIGPSAKATASGKLKRAHAGKKHLNSPKTAKRKRRLRRPAVERNKLVRKYIVVMGGECQAEWEHTVPKTARQVGARMSVTIRHRQPAPGERMLREPRLHSRAWPQGWENWARAAEVALPPGMVERSFDHFSHVLEAAAAGLGVATAPWIFVADEVAAGRLVAPFGFVHEPGRTVMVRPNGPANPALDRLAAWLAEQGEQMPRPPKALS